ncbi:thermonuclease family protein [Hyphomonas sp.]|uniref:thermonuclease family protein n=1 Tax=Hyphomonas sp. TaxID=87 RepID=UPI0025B840CE|nr:thermonuclease family protein [Hyphomonas sp.]
MARRGTVLEFRRARRPKQLAPGPARTDKLQFLRRAKTGIRTLLAVFAFFTGILFCLLSGERWMQIASASAAATTSSIKPLEVHWVDGDSGTIDGRAFRLYGVDAPEDTPSLAQCNTERFRANEARLAVRALMGSGTVEIRKSHGIDKYDRELLSLSVDGRDVASSLITSGHVKRWNYEAGDAKPRWC